MDIRCDKCVYNGTPATSDPCKTCAWNTQHVSQYPCFKPRASFDTAASAWQTDEPTRDGTWWLARRKLTRHYVAIKWYPCDDCDPGAWLDENGHEYSIKRFDLFAPINPYIPDPQPMHNDHAEV